MPDLTLNDSNVDDQIARDIAKAAKSVAYQWPGVIEACDVEQSIWLELLQAPATFQTLRTMDSGPRYRTISKLGHRIASGERADYEHFSGDFRYSVNEVKNLLDAGVLGVIEHTLRSSYSAQEYTTKGGGVEDVVLTKVAAETDLRRAMGDLDSGTPQYADVIRRRYLYGENVTATGAEYTRLSRALTRLTDLMNRIHKRRHAERLDGPGTRRAISSASARAISAANYSRTSEVDPYRSPTRVQEGRI